MDFLVMFKNFVGTPEIWAFLFGYVLGVKSKIAKFFIKRYKNKSIEKKWILRRKRLIDEQVRDENDLHKLNAQELKNFIAEYTMIDEDLRDFTPKNPLS